MNETVEPASLFSRLRIGAIVALAAAGVFIGWLILKDDSDSAQKAEQSGPVAASLDELERLPGELDHTVYWAGARRRYAYELTRLADGRIYIRYLAPGVRVGDRRANFLTIGTYPHPNAFGTVQKASQRKGEYVRRLSGGGLAVASPSIPRSVYFAYPGSDYLIEVYDSSPARARRLVTSGRVRPIE